MSRNILEHLSVEQVSELFRWLSKHFPREDDPEEREGHAYAVTSRHQVARLRDAIPNSLRTRASFESAEALRQLAAEVELPWLDVLAEETLDAAAQSTWTPPTLGEFLELTKDPSNRLLRTADELLSFIVESLGRLEKRLHAETPAVFDLWNEVAKGRFKPKDEGHLSDYVKRHLADDLRRHGVATFREVEIARSIPKRRGERTDLHVDATVLIDSRQVHLRAIIEVKGCWNRELNTGLEDQLVRRYLARDTRHGLYLVGWFACRSWTASDRRRAASPRWSLDRARKHFSAQAANASVPNGQVRAFVLRAALD